MEAHAKDEWTVEQLLAIISQVAQQIEDLADDYGSVHGDAEKSRIAAAYEHCANLLRTSINQPPKSISNGRSSGNSSLAITLAFISNGHLYSPRVNRTK